MTETPGLLERSAREVIPSRYYLPFLVILFITALFSAYAFARPVGEVDWVMTAQQIRNLWRGINPFCTPFCRFTAYDADLFLNDSIVRTQVYAPWIMFYFGPLAFASARLVLALDVAFWVVIVLDSGRLPALILILHPAFLMLLAAANIDFLVGGVALWLLLRGVRGWRRGITLMLMLIKAQVLPLLVMLETARAVWERDWRALTTMTGILGVSTLLYPRWLTGTIPAYIGVFRGTRHDEVLYPFSVLGAWGLPAALMVTGLLILLMRKRLTEWRTLAILLCFVWTPYVHPYSFAILLLLFLKEAPWRIGLYLALSLALLPVLFREYHEYERYGTLLFLLFVPLLTRPDLSQTEYALAARNGVPTMPLVLYLGGRRPQ